MSGNGGAGGMPGVKKNKSMNAYAKGGAVMPEAANGVNGTPMSGKARGGNAALKGLNFKS